MDGSIVPGSSRRKRLLEIYRGSGGKELHHPQVRLRAHVILLLSEGHPWSLIEQVLFCSFPSAKSLGFLIGCHLSPPDAERM
jgi:hypothetical protein